MRATIPQELGPEAELLAELRDRVRAVEAKYEAKRRLGTRNHDAQGPDPADDPDDGDAPCGGSAFFDTCGSAGFLSGVAGRTGNLVDRVQGYCRSQN